MGLAYDSDYLQISSEKLTFSETAKAKLNAGGKMDIWTELNAMDTNKYITNFSISDATITKNEYNLNSNNVLDGSLTTFQTYVGKYYNNSDVEIGSSGLVANATKINIYLNFDVAKSLIIL